MEKIIQFIVDHWELVTECACALILIIITCCKRCKVSVKDNCLTALLLSLPDLVKEAELAYPEAKTGEDKLKYVLKLAIAKLVGLTGKSSEECLALYGSTIMQAIEDILAAPTKVKGD